tara:strand:+ start:596 stop:796 length:201 start_codon:yes stop_codon:yes gene_type:complete
MIQNLKMDFKFILNVVSLLGAVTYGYFEMEARITQLETKIQNYDKMNQLRIEIQGLKNGYAENSIN